MRLDRAADGGALACAGGDPAGEARGAQAEGGREVVHAADSVGSAPQGGGGLGGVGGGVGEELPAGAGVAHGTERAGVRGAGGGGVVLVGRDAAQRVADLRAREIVGVE